MGFPNAIEIEPPLNPPSEHLPIDDELNTSENRSESTNGESDSRVRVGRPATGPYSARKAAQERWRAKNQEKVKGYQKRWRERNSGALKEAQKAYRTRNADKVKEWQKKSRRKRRALRQARNNQL